MDIKIVSLELINENEYELTTEVNLPPQTDYTLIYKGSEGSQCFVDAPMTVGDFEGPTVRTVNVIQGEGVQTLVVTLLSTEGSTEDQKEVSFPSNGGHLGK